MRWIARCGGCDAGGGERDSVGVGRISRLCLSEMRAPCVMKLALVAEKTYKPSPYYISWAPTN